MPNVVLYCFGWDLRVIGMHIVKRIVFTLAHVSSEWLSSVIISSRVIRFSIVLDEIGQKRVRAGGVVRRVGQRENILVRADWESLDTAELSVLQLLAQDAEEVLPPCLVVRE